ncbi:MAG: response regulator transcription factor [Bacteroidetes bacterium]|nr:response regulator transcription factor [Bacteroidota bacterium]
MTNRILLVEDEKSLATTLQYNLEAEGYTVTLCGTGLKALEAFNEGRYDLVILDIMLPGISGFDVLESIRVKDETTPVLVLSARYQDPDRIRGLKSGADDYMTKPFNLEELLLRVARLIRRTAAKPDVAKFLTDTFTFGKNTIYFSQHEAATSNGRIELTAKETELLKLLIQNEGQVVSREIILSRVWGYDVYPTTRTIDNFISRLRKYFEDDPSNPVFIHSIRGVGYKFTGDPKK